jgi:hypothetical protein
MIRTRILFLALAGSASLASAQIRPGACKSSKMGGSTCDDTKEINSQVKPGLRLSNGDVEDMSPIHLFLDKRKDLKLTDDQLKQVREMDKKLQADTKPEFKSLDSLRNALRMSGTDQTTAEELRQKMARDEVTNVLTSIRGDYDEAEKAALALLDPTQTAKAQELLAKQRKDAEETLKDKLAPGMAMNSGGGGRKRP